MNFKEYIEQLKEFYDGHPECHNMKVVYAKDDEGNGYSNVIYNASFGEYDGENFYNQDDTDKINAVCIN